jgi:hypothetical protein
MWLRIPGALPAQLGACRDSSLKAFPTAANKKTLPGQFAGPVKRAGGGRKIKSFSFCSKSKSAQNLNHNSQNPKPQSLEQHPS